MLLVYLKPDKPTYMQLTRYLMLIGVSLSINHFVSIQNMSDIWETFKG